MARRTSRLIRVSDPECYRLFLGVTGGVRMDQAGHRVTFRARDIGLYDVSRPWRTMHSTTAHPMRVVMVTFPRTLLSISRAAVRPLIGTILPSNLPGRSLVAQLLVDLTDDDTVTADDCGLADVLRECVVGLVRQRLGLPAGITPHTRRLLYRASIRTVIRRHLGDPTLGPDGIARAANVSPRYLHTIFQDAELTPMQLLKQMRLAQCHRSLQNPALAATPIRDIIAAHGYHRPDQFARYFKKTYGMSATQVRKLAQAVE